ncbi:MAG: hypothetical protein IKU36_13005 [Bacteroidales bacterium]|nr:hypothetical protein [Bacteroidales bacterium]
MAEYIDKQALIEGMAKVDGRKWSTKTLGEVLDAIGSIEIVRCKDCKWSYTDEAMLICVYRGFFVNDMFYCADGERREDEAD